MSDNEYLKIGFCSTRNPWLLVTGHRLYWNFVAKWHEAIKTFASSSAQSVTFLSSLQGFLEWRQNVALQVRLGLILSLKTKKRWWQEQMSVIDHYNIWSEVKWKPLSRVRLFTTPWTIQSMKFSRPEYWSGISPGDIPNPGIEPRSPALQVDSLPVEPLPGKPKNTGVGSLSLLQRIFPTHKSNWGLLHCRQILY